MQCMPKQVIPRLSLFHFLFSRMLSIENKLKMQNYNVSPKNTSNNIMGIGKHTCNDCGWTLLTLT